MKRSDLIAMIKQHEGFSAKVYKCTAGKNTVWWGRNIDDNPLSIAEFSFLLENGPLLTANLCLENDITTVENQLKKYDWFVVQPIGVQYALIDMGFMGVRKLLKFYNMIAALKAKNYTVAALEALDSDWAKEVKNRAKDIALIIREGK